jgi:hypothetical protein
MKSKLAIVFAALLSAVTIPAAYAQTEQVAKAQIPFDFYVDGKQLPAGTYMVGVDVENKLITLTDQSNDHASFASGYQADNGGINTPQLLFDRVGDSYVLSEVETDEIGIAVANPRHSNPEATSAEAGMSIPLRATMKGD